MARCEKCGQPIPNERIHPRVCYLCGVPIARHHKFMFVRKDGASTVQHRHCEDPEAYVLNGENRQSPWQPKEDEK